MHRSAALIRLTVDGVEKRIGRLSERQTERAILTPRMSSTPNSSGSISPSPTPPPMPDAPLSLLEIRVLGCLMEKEWATPDIYPLSLNALINACNQRSNRAPLLSVEALEVEVALEGLRGRKLVALFSGADARVAKYKQTFDLVYPIAPEARALIAELMLRGPQTTAGLRGNSERLLPMPDLPAVEDVLADLAARAHAPVVRKLPRQTGQKEIRWAHTLSGEPSADDHPAGSAVPTAALAAEPLRVRLTLPPEAERRIAALEAEVARLATELTRLRAALGE